MKGVALTGNRRAELMEFPDPEPGPQDVVLEIKASGICGSDLHGFRKPDRVAHPVIAGHEPAGIVIAKGSGVGDLAARIGDRVMVHHYSGCGGCEDCRPGWTQMCKVAPMQLYGGNAHGAHAPYLRVPAATLLPLHETLSWQAGATIGCGTGTAWGALRRLNLTGADTIAIFGQGPVGQSATLLASALGARVIAIDIANDRLERAKSFGAAEVINPSEGGSVERIRELTDGKGASMALETSGASPAATDALNCVRPWGTVSLVGIGGEVRFEVFQFIPKQITIQTSWSMSLLGMKECADFVVSRSLDLDRLFTDQWKIEDAQIAYDKFDKQVGGKAYFAF